MEVPRGESMELVDLSTLRHSPDWGHWGTLVADAPPYLTPEFFSLVTPLAEGKPMVAGAWSDGRMIGALPLLLHHESLHALRIDHSPGYDYCGTPAGIDAIWRGLRHDHRWSELVLDRVPAESLLATRLPELARADGCKVVVRPDSNHLFFDLTGFEARMNAKFRTNVQRCARKVGDLVLERIAVPTRAAFEEAMAIEAMAWKGAAGTSIEHDPQVTHLYRALSLLLGRRGRAALYFLRAEHKRIATLFAVEDDHTLYALKIGYDPEYAKVSPGHLMVWKAAADAERRGLTRFDFVGREDDWKHKWTDQVHARVVLVIYRHSLRGMLRYSLREHLRPHLPEPMRSTPRSPLPRRCQAADRIGLHSLGEVVHDRLAHGLGIRSRLARVFADPPAPRPPLGEPSRFAPGSWVRVIDEPRLRTTLDANDRNRGLPFVASQWASCGRLYRVHKHVLRIRDDHGRYRPIHRTVLLEGLDCSGDGEVALGCGRHCPLMYRDEWLEAASAPARGPTVGVLRRHARVRNLDEITATLDLHGRREGLTFMPEMAQYAGQRLAIARQLGNVFELDRWSTTPHRIFILEGIGCSGALAGDDGPCHRSCAVMWHEDWLHVEPERT